MLNRVDYIMTVNIGITISFIDWNMFLLLLERLVVLSGENIQTDHRKAPTKTCAPGPQYLETPVGTICKTKCFFFLSHLDMTSKILKVT